MSIVNCNIQGFLEVVSNEGIKLFNISTILSIKPIELSVNGLTKINIKFITGNVYICYVRTTDIEVFQTEESSEDMIDLYESLIH